MENKKKKYLSVIVAIIVALIVYIGLRSTGRSPEPLKEDVAPPAESTTQTYSTEKFSVEHPSSYAVGVDNVGIVTISNPKGKIMIGNFSPGAGPSPAEVGEYNTLLRDTKYHGYNEGVTSAIYCAEDDEKTMNELLEIQSSIQLK